MERFENSPQAPANNGSSLADFVYGKDTMAPEPAGDTRANESFTYAKDPAAGSQADDSGLLPDLKFSNDSSTIGSGSGPLAGENFTYGKETIRNLPLHPNAMPDDLPENKGPKEYPGLGNNTLPLPETVERGDPNFCDKELLKSAPGDLNTVRRDEPVGIDEWGITGRGDHYANQALGNDPNDPASERKLNEWLNKTAAEVDVELRELYNLPKDATNIEVAKAMISDGDRGGRFCALSQGVVTSEQLYEAIQRDIITSTLSKQYQQRANRAN